MPHAGIITRAARHDLARRLPLALGGVLVLMLLIDGICSLVGSENIGTIWWHADITAHGYMASWFMEGVCLLTGVSALALAQRSFRANGASSLAAAGWVIVGTAFFTLALIEVIGMPANSPTVFVLVPMLGIPLVAFLYWQLWPVVAVRGLLVAAAILFLSDPFTEKAKLYLASNPRFYIFVADDQPYRLTRNAWVLFWFADHAQEAAEIAGTICLLAAFLTVLGLPVAASGEWSLAAQETGDGR